MHVKNLQFDDDVIVQCNVLWTITHISILYNSVYTCGVATKQRTSDLNVIGSRPPLAVRHIRYFAVGQCSIAHIS